MRHFIPDEIWPFPTASFDFSWGCWPACLLWVAWHFRKEAWCQVICTKGEREHCLPFRSFLLCSSIHLLEACGGIHSVPFHLPRETGRPLRMIPLPAHGKLQGQGWQSQGQSELIAARGRRICRELSSYRFLPSLLNNALFPSLPYSLEGKGIV